MRRLYLILVSIFVLGLVSPFTLESAPVINDAQEPKFLFVLNAKSGLCDGKMLTLNNVPLAIYFSDRPNRIAGHMSLKKFIKHWNKGDDSFKADPPNATLSILTKKRNKDIVVELMKPRLKGDTLTFKVQLLKGKITKSFGLSSIFIDAFPTSVNSQITD